MPRHLFIVSRETPYLAEYMREQFGDEPNIEVFVDRRRGQGDVEAASDPHQHPRHERRERLGVDRELRESFHVLVTLA
jgi:hypothetical protein